MQRTVAGRHREAERELSRLLGEVDEGRFVASPAMTLNDLFDRWLDVKRQAVEPSTWSNYEWITRKYIRPALGDRKVGSLRPIDLDLLYSELGARGLSVRTVRICHTVLRQALEQARKWGFISRSPAVDASPPPQRRAEVTPPTLAQVIELLEVVLSIALGRHDSSSRFKEVIHPAERHWMHHLELEGPDDIDDEVVAWLREAAERAG